MLCCASSQQQASNVPASAIGCAAYAANHSAVSSKAQSRTVPYLELVQGALLRAQ